MSENYHVFQLYCDNCHWKLITNGDDLKSLYEVKSSKLQSSIPKYDPIAKKTIESTFANQRRKFRCPGCGHLVLLKMIPDTQKTQDAIREVEKRVAERKALEESVLKDQNRRKNDEKDRSARSKESDEGFEISGLPPDGDEG